jgi:3-oxoacyl-[acyl-carrier protein] reductase
VTYLRLDPTVRGVSADDAAHADETGDAMYHAFRTHSAQHLVDGAAATGHTLVAKELDLRLGQAAAVELFDAVEKQLGPADVLVNSAAQYADTDTTESVSEHDFDETFRVNTRATLLLTQEFARRFRARARAAGADATATHGRVINLSTDAAPAFAGQVTYGASKAAIEALTRSAAVELGTAGITVNAVAPGPVQTSYISPDAERRLAPEIPLGRIGTPEDIARVIVFLASEHAGWITGQVLRVDGGHSL